MASEIRVNQIQNRSGLTTTTFSDTGVDIVGVATATTFSGSGASLTNLNASNIASGTVPTARLGSGTANSSTFLRGDSTFATVTSTTINNNADNRLITGSGTANTLEGESELTYDSPQLKLISTSAAPQIRINSAADDAAATRFTIGRATGNNHFVNGASPGDSAITVGGNLLFGVGTSEKLRLQSGGGISFNGDSAATNALDDYEEGDHTTTVTMSGDTSFSYNARTLAYTKIGRVVHITGRINISGAGGSSFRFTLPFTCGDNSFKYETSNEFQNIRFNDGYTFRIRANTAYADLQNDGSDTGIGTNDPHINVSLTYFTTT